MASIRWWTSAVARGSEPRYATDDQRQRCAQQQHECAENEKALAGAPAIGDGTHDRRDQDRVEPLTGLAQAHYRTLLVAADVIACTDRMTG